MNERIDHGANLLKNHVFQFDFLNDDFTKLTSKFQELLMTQKNVKNLLFISIHRMQRLLRKNFNWKEG